MLCRPLVLRHPLPRPGVAPLGSSRHSTGLQSPCRPLPPLGAATPASTCRATTSRLQALRRLTLGARLQIPASRSPPPNPRRYAAVGERCTKPLHIRL